MGGGWAVGLDEVRAVLERIAAVRWEWTAQQLPGVLRQLGWTALEDDELGVTVDLGPAFAGAGWPTTRVTGKDAAVRTTSLILTSGNADDAADALRLGDVFARMVEVASEVLGAPSDRRSGFLQVVSWRRGDDQGTIQLRQHRYAVNLRWASNAYQVTLDQRDAAQQAEQADADRQSEKREAGGELLIGPVLGEDPSWERFGQVFARSLTRLREGSTLILGRPENNYLQFQYSAGRDGLGDLSVEVSSNGVRKRGARLSEADEQQLRELGFTLPKPPFDDENWRHQHLGPIDGEVAGQLTGRVLSALQQVMRVQRPAELSVKAFTAVG